MQYRRRRKAMDGQDKGDREAHVPALDPGPGPHVDTGVLLETKEVLIASVCADRQVYDHCNHCSKADAWKHVVQARQEWGSCGCTAARMHWTANPAERK